LRKTQLQLLLRENDTRESSLAIYFADSNDRMYNAEDDRRFSRDTIRSSDERSDLARKGAFRSIAGRSAGNGKRGESNGRNIRTSVGGVCTESTIELTLEMEMYAET